MKAVATGACLWMFVLAACLIAQSGQSAAQRTIWSDAEHAAAMKEVGSLSVALNEAIRAANEADAAKASARLTALFRDVSAYWNVKRTSADDSAPTAAQNAGTALDVISEAVAQHNMAAAAQANRMLQVMCDTCHADHGDRLPDSWFGAAPAQGVSTASGIWSGVYTEAQAKRGEEISNHSWCTTCHGSELAGNEAPSLVGQDFLANWTSQSLGDLFDKIHKTMPADAPGTLSAAETSDVIARVLQLNKFPAGPKDLSTDLNALNLILIEGPQTTK